MDSSFVAYNAKKYNLRILAVHLDNGWNTELSVNNIENCVSYLNADLYTHVIDWNEFKKGYNEGISAHKTMNVTK